MTHSTAVNRDSKYAYARNKNMGAKTLGGHPKAAIRYHLKTGHRE